MGFLRDWEKWREVGEEIRAGIMGGCKPTKSHVEVREERREKEVAVSLAAG